MYLYLTHDQIGGWTGGNKVTQKEAEALCRLAEAHKVPFASFDKDDVANYDPFDQDARLLKRLGFYLSQVEDQPVLVHCYSGCMTKTITWLKSCYPKCKVVYTIAAHDRHVSRQEHEKLGFSFPYPHLVHDHIWQDYIEGYRLADTIVTPSTHSKKVVEGYGFDFTGKTEIIPHGVDIPEETAEYPPSRFAVGYMGAFGPDKGVRYLLEAWASLGMRDGTLYLAGKDSISPLAQHLVGRFGRGNIVCLGWVDDLADFYRRLTVYVQPSATEGFGLEILEAMAHGIPVVASEGAGGSDCVQEKTQAGNPAEIAEAIRMIYGKTNMDLVNLSVVCCAMAGKYAWPRIKQQYIDLWEAVLHD